MAFAMFFTPFLVPAQDCEAYNRLMQEAKDARYIEDFETAIKKYNLAMLNCPINVVLIQDEFVLTFNEIESLKEMAELEREKAENAQAHSQKLIDMFYFYDDKIALAFKNGKFGFINKRADVVIDFDYDKAKNFDDTGYANVEKAGIKYLINAKGDEYKVAYSLVDLNPEIKAIDLRSEELSALPAEIFEFEKLEIVILYGGVYDIHIAGRPTPGPGFRYYGLDIDKARRDTKIIHIDTICVISQIPKEIIKMNNLVYLHLMGSEIPDEEKEEIQKILPNCKIEW